MRLAWLLPVVLIAITAQACSGGSSSGSGDGGRSTLILTMADGSLDQIDASSGARHTLMSPEPGGFLLYPSASPDGSRIAFVSQPPPAADGAADSGFDLWTAARDGSDRKLVFHHAAPNQQVTFPQWADAAHILAVVQEQGPNGIVYTLEEFELATGARERLREGVLGFGVSADGTQVAFTTLDDASVLTLNISNAADGPATPVSTTQDGLSPFGWPRFAPGDAGITFTAAEVARTFRGPQTVSFGPPRDGLPQDVWQIATTGGEARRMADLKEDNPTFAWNADGSHLYVNGAKGVFDVDMASGAIDRLTDGTFHGQIAWMP